MPSKKELDRYAALARPSPSERGNLIMQLNVGDVVSIGRDVEVTVTALEASDSIKAPRRLQTTVSVRAPRSMLINKRRIENE